MLQTVPHTGTVLTFGKEHHHLSQRTGRQGNVYQRRDPGKWNPQAPAYGRFWIDVRVEIGSAKRFRSGRAPRNG
jgi:hypothetical protein